MAHALDVPGLGRLPVGKIVGIGKNYEDHVKEMQGKLWSSGQAVDQAPPPDPVLFLKPATALVPDGGRVVVPAGVGEVHHETELAVVIGRAGRRIARERALDHVAGYAIALDLTARDLQQAAKKAGLPWDIAKGMDTFCPIGAVKAAAEVPDPQDVELVLEVNGAVRQKGSTRDMIRPIPDLVAYASRWFTLEPGDVILTGTPGGVGPIRPGDALRATASHVGSLAVDVVADDE